MIDRSRSGRVTMKPFRCFSRFILIVAMSSFAPLYEQAPLALVPARTLTQFPVNTFLESIIAQPDGSLWVSNHEAGQVVRITPDGSQQVLANWGAKVAGLVALPNGEALLNAWNGFGTPVILKVAATGGLELLATLEGAIFPNGWAYLGGDRYLLADSYRGVIWQFEVGTKAVGLWLEHPLLARRDPDSVIPGVNGLKVWQDKLYASNTERQVLLKIAIGASGLPSEPEVWIESTNIDDFAFDPAGNLYGTTHIFNSVIRITPAGETSIIASADQGIAGVTGSTAVAFGKTEADRHCLYVVGNGGMFLPPMTGVLPAEVVVLTIGNG
jgi:sugar lactone lactonase YvrE